MWNSGMANIRPRQTWLLWLSSGLLSETCFFVCQLSTSSCSLASGMCPHPPQQSLNSYQGDEDVLGLEWADLGLNVWSRLTDQGLLMFKAALTSRWHEKWQSQKALLACSLPAFRISIYFHSQGIQFRGHKAFVYLWPWKILLLWTKCWCPPQIFMLKH